MTFHRSVSSPKVTEPTTGNHGEGAIAGPAQTGEHNRLLQIPDHAPPRSRAENPIRDWDAPLDSVGQSPSYYYEPQGELLQEQRNQPVRSEVSIPHAVGDRLAQGSPLDLSGSNGFAIPKRLSGVALATAGVKRKSTSSGEDPSSGNHPEPKRLSRTVSDMEDELDTTSDRRPPAQSARSQNGSANRTRSGTGTSENVAMPTATDAEPARPVRPGPGITGGRQRTTTDPSAPVTLPARKVFPIQIGDKLFRLSGASISSDGKRRGVIASM